jgi:hypothetical protein
VAVRGNNINVVFALIMGIIVGFIVSKLGKIEIPYDDTSEFKYADYNEN